jgi:hypothetical protein
MAAAVAALVGGVLIGGSGVALAQDRGGEHSSEQSDHSPESGSRDGAANQQQSSTGGSNDSNDGEGGSGGK